MTNYRGSRVFGFAGPIWDLRGFTRAPSVARNMLVASPCWMRSSKNVKTMAFVVQIQTFTYIYIHLQCIYNIIQYNIISYHMIWYNIIYQIILYYIILYCVMLYYIYYIISYYIISYHIILYYIILYYILSVQYVYIYIYLYICVQLARNMRLTFLYHLRHGEQGSACCFSSCQRRPPWWLVPCSCRAAWNCSWASFAALKLGCSFKSIQIHYVIYIYIYSNCL